MAVALLVSGTLLLLLGVPVYIDTFRERGRRARIVATPAPAIADAPDGGPVAIQGRIVPGEQGLLIAPFSGREAVWMRVAVSVRRMGAKHSSDILNETAERPFLLDDGSGQLARIEPHGAAMVLDVQKLAHTGTFQDAPPQLEQFLQAHGKTSEGLFLNKDMSFWEQALIPGGNLTAIGPARRESPSAQLVLRQGEGAAGELILTDRTRENLIAGEKRGVGCAWKILGAGALLDVAGLVVLAVDKLL